MKRPVPVLAVLAAGLLTLTACGGSSNADAVGDDGSIDLSQVTLVVGDQKGGSEALLTASGDLDEVAYDIEFKPFTSGPPLLEAVSSGAVDVGGVGNTPPLFAIDQDKALKIVSANDQGATGDSIVVPKGSRATSVEQLRGKKVAVAKGSSANYNLVAQLKDAGLTLDDVEPVWLQPTEALAAFRGGSVDAWAIWDPFTSQAELGSGARVLSDGAGLVNGLGFQVAGDEALDDAATRAAIGDYLGRLAAAQTWAADHKEEWSAAWSKETGLPREVTDRATSRRAYVPIPVTDEVIASEQEMWDAFAEQGQVSGDPDLKEYFVTDFNDTVAEAAAEQEGRS